jgi:hypothetical protein
MGLIKEAILTGTYPGKTATKVSSSKRLSNDIIGDQRDQEIVKEDRYEQITNSLL